MKNDLKKGIVSKLSTSRRGDETQALSIKATLLLSESLHYTSTYTKSLYTNSNSNSPPQQPSPPLPSRNPYTEMQQTPLGFYDASYQPGPGPLYQGMAPSSKHVQQQHYLLPSRRQKKRFRKTGPQQPDHQKHESSGEVSYDRSTGVNPGMSQNNANNNPGKGKVWEPRQLERTD